MRVTLAPGGRGHRTPSPHRIATWLGLAAALALLLATPATAADDSTTILLAGDSITQGTGGDTSYRCELWELLTNVDFAGTRSEAGDCETPGFDPDHEGYGGHGLTDGPPGYPQLRLETYMSINGAFDLSYDAVLLHAGTNDKNSVDALWNDEYVDEIEAEMRTLIGRLRDNNPTTTIYLAEIIPCGHGPGGDFLGCGVTHADMNERFAEIAADSSTPGSPIVLIDHTRGFLISSDLKPDLVHPNASGAAKLADNWALGLAAQGELLAEPVEAAGSANTVWLPSDTTFASRPLVCAIVPGIGAWELAAVAPDCSGGTFAAGGLSEGEYTFRYSATDFGTNQWGSATHFGVVTVTVDRTNPVWPAGELSTVAGENSIAVAWPAATDTNGVDHYVLYEDGIPVAAPTGTAFTRVGLADGVTHTYTVEAVDGAGNRSLHPGVAIATTPDTSAPEWTSGALQATSRSASSITLGWPAAVDNVAVDRYSLTKNGYWITDVPATATSHTVGDFMLSEEARFQVAAYDAAGNSAMLPAVDIGVGSIGAGVGLVNAGSRWDLTDAEGDTTSFFFGTPGDYPFMGDWDCDGIDTPGLYRQSDGYVYLRNSNSFGPTDREFFFGIAGDIPIVGDFNGDGCDTVSIYRRGRVFIINELGQDGGNLGFADFDYFFGVPGDVPFTGDFDADGIDEVGLFRQTNGYVYFTLNHPGSGVATTDNEFFFGIGGDQIVAGDWTNDLTDTVGIYRASAATFYLRYSNTLGFADEVLPAATSGRPVAGRYDLG